MNRKTKSHHIFHHFWKHSVSPTVGWYEIWSSQEKYHFWLFNCYSDAVVLVHQFYHNLDPGINLLSPTQSTNSQSKEQNIKKFSYYKKQQIV